MPFDKNTKARMFIKCARICCLCFRQCGVNMEAAHIIDEFKGGTNDDDNGIPLCFDCHQEIGAYNDKHPKGNKFTPKELKARREKIYELVENGALQAQIISGKIHNQYSKEEVDVTNIEAEYKPTKEVTDILNLAQSSGRPVESIPLKLDLLSKQEQAYIIDKLLEDFDSNEALSALIEIISNDKSQNENLLILEQILRRITISISIDLKRDFMRSVPLDLLKQTDEGLRIAFFTEIIGILELNQFRDVNPITPNVPRIQEAIPDVLLDRYLKAMLEMVKSHAWDGKPAATQALMSLPNDIASRSLQIVNDRNFFFYHRDQFYKDFVRNYTDLWDKKDKEIFTDFTTLTDKDFMINGHLIV